MSLIDFILNVAGLLLALNLRSVRLDPFARPVPSTLSGTLRRAEPNRIKRWHWLTALAALLGLRGVFYWQIGPAVSWTPKVDLTFVTLAFPLRDDPAHFAVAELFSVLSFVETLVVFHFWLLALVVINGPQTESDPLHKMILLQVGRTARWSRGVLAVLPVLAVAALWLVFHPLLARGGVLNPARAASHLLAQAALVGVGIYSSLKYLLPVLLFLHLVSSYVYLGASPLWEFVGLTSRNLLAPLTRLPLRLGKVDLAPLVGIVLILLLLHALPNLVLNQLNARNLTLWPQ